MSNIEISSSSFLLQSNSNGACTHIYIYVLRNECKHEIQRRGYNTFWWVRNLIYRMITDQQVIYSMFFLSPSDSFIITKKEEKQKRSLVTDNDGRYSVSLSLSFFTMIIGQLRVNIELLQSAFFFLSNRSFFFSRFFSSSYWDIRHYRGRWA